MVEKGGKEKMEVIQSEMYVETCRFCGKRFPATPYKKQAESWKESHEKFCKSRPSIIEDE